MSRFPDIPEELTDDLMAETENVRKPQAAHSASGSADSNEPIISLRSVRARVEVEAIRSALMRTGWNRKQAARLLKISYRGLLYKIRQYDITAA